MFFGAAYYPEHLDRDMIIRDAKLMVKCGINLVRMGEFAWVKMEPQEGKYDFSWLDDAIEILWSHGIKALLCTPTAAPPKWLTDKHTDIYQTLSNGSAKSFGKRRHYCINNANYYQYTEKIVSALANHYKDNQSVIGYQLDNEFMAEEPYCYCERCRGKFQNVLMDEYGTIDNLNRSWGLIFWGQCYSQWNQIIIPRHGHNPSALLKFRAFVSDSFINYATFQKDIIKEISPHKMVTHNIASSGFLYLMDLYKLGEKLDVISMDNYPLGWTLETEYGIRNTDKPITFDFAMTSFSLAITRSCKKSNFWITEAQTNRTGAHEKRVDPGLVRLWTYQEVTHGAEVVIYFPWRTCPFGSEQHIQGILACDNIPRRVYFEVQKTIGELTNTPKTYVDADVAIIRDFQCDWTFEDDIFSPDFKYAQHIFSYYDAFVKNHITVDVVSPIDDLSKYKIVVVPSLILTDGKKSAKLYEYTKSGGTLILTCLSGLKDLNGNIKSTVMPAELRELAGVEIEEQYRLYNVDFEKIHVRDDRFAKEQYDCRIWCDILKTTKALTIATHFDILDKETSIITVNKYGDGAVYYVGTIPSKDFLGEFVSILCEECRVNSPIACSSEQVEIVKAKDESSEYVYVINYSNQEQVLKTNNKYIDIKNGSMKESRFYIAAFDAQILLLKDM